MIHFIEILQYRNLPLFIFGCVNMLGAIVFAVMTKLSGTVVRGINAWLKPFKFALSIGTFSWTMGWYTYELKAPVSVNIYNWVTIALLGFEIVYIGLQAARGQLSHYNVSSKVYSVLTVFMGVAAAIVTVWTGYIGILFWSADLKNLPDYYVLSIRISIFLFVFFAFEGASMGARRTHTVGGREGPAALPLFNWSTRYGDLRIAHFIGMHALQLLPLLSWYVLKNTLATEIACSLYGLLTVFTLKNALKGKPLIASSDKTRPFSAK